MEKINKLYISLIILLCLTVFILSMVIVYQSVIEPNNNDKCTSDKLEEETSNDEAKTEEETSNDEDKTEDLEFDYEIISVGEYDKKLVINGYDFEIIAHDFGGFNHLGDALMFYPFYMGDDGYSNVYIVSDKAEILNYFAGSCVDSEYNNILLSGCNVDSNYKKIGEEFYFTSINYANGGPCPIIKMNGLDYVLEVTEKFTYLGKGQFSDSTIVEKLNGRNEKWNECK